MKVLLSVLRGWLSCSANILPHLQFTGVDVQSCPSGHARNLRITTDSPDGQCTASATGVRVGIARIEQPCCSYVRLQAFSHNSFLSGFDDESICVELLNKAG
ncbi:hypothetical protein, partial [Ensifer sp. Root31]|uniref:hypothetical protein n=1 Tax=Ensifer sp. Root31 TaxID=1736512 RepID=UPI001AEC77E1